MAVNGRPGEDIPVKTNSIARQAASQVGCIKRRADAPADRLSWRRLLSRYFGAEFDGPYGSGVPRIETAEPLGWLACRAVSAQNVRFADLLH